MQSHVQENITSAAHLQICDAYQCEVYIRPRPLYTSMYTVLIAFKFVLLLSLAKITLTVYLQVCDTRLFSRVLRYSAQVKRSLTKSPLTTFQVGILYYILIEALMGNELLQLFSSRYHFYSVLQVLLSNVIIF